MRWFVGFGCQTSLNPSSRRAAVAYPLDILHCLLQRNPLLGCNDEMEMIGHDYELVELESSFAAIEIERVNQQFGSVCILEKCVPPVRHDVTKKVLIS
ncbi:MAG TPA: hypothetical protein VFB79_04135 [Candidatus Angelobacter sp.]|nr:hypothetical protein [Candidatus Angelobacter sp.]